jgi:hypothetical protein
MSLFKEKQKKSEFGLSSLEGFFSSLEATINEKVSALLPKINSKVSILEHEALKSKLSDYVTQQAFASVIDGLKLDFTETIDKLVIPEDKSREIALINSAIKTLETTFSKRFNNIKIPEVPKIDLTGFIKAEEFKSFEKEINETISKASSELDEKFKKYSSYSGGSGYAQLFANGTKVKRRNALNFIGATLADNPTTGATDITITASGGTWGSITGTLSSQTDLQTALNAKQDTLVSGTNIKTINSTSLLGSGDIVISGGSVAGSDTQVQFNDSGSFGGDAGLTYNKTTDALTVNGLVHTPIVQAHTSAGLILEAQGGGDVLLVGAGGGVNATAYGGWNFDAATANTIAGFGASKTLESLSTATYPSLTELSYVKGVSSAIQTQISALPTVSFSTLAVSGQSNVVADSASDTLTLVAGTNVTITTDAATDSITINATGGGSSAFNAITSGTNTTAAMVVGTGGSLAATGSGTIVATSTTGNAATVTTNANLTGDVTSTGNATAIASGVIVNDDVNASAGILLSKTNISLTTTGSSGASTLNTTTGVLNIPQYTGGSGTTNNVTPTARLATTAALPANTYLANVLTAVSVGVLTVDGVAVAANDVILVKNEGTGANNGLYTCTTAGTAGIAYVLTRHTSMDTGAEFVGAVIPVGAEGTTNKNTEWRITNATAPTVGTTAITTAIQAIPLTSGVTGVLPVANGGTNASSAGITAFNNITGYTAAGATGTTSTNLVFSTSPTLTTPVLGAATSTSLVVNHTAQLTTGGLTASSQQFGTTAGTGTKVLGMFNTTAGTSAALQFYRSKNAAIGSATVVASGDRLGQIDFFGAQLTGSFSIQNRAAQIRAEVDGTVTSGAAGDMPGRLVFSTTPDASGTVTDRLILDAAGILKPNANDGVALGTATLSYADLFLASGAVLNYANSNVVITHTSGILTMGTGDLRVTTAGTNTASVVTVGGTQTLTAKTLTAPSIGGAVTLAENASIDLDAILSADGTYSGECITGTAGTTLAFGDLVYFSAVDSRWELTDADASATAGPVWVGMCVLAAAADGNATKILLRGTIRADTAFPALTISAPVYVSTTAGDIQVAAPNATDDVVRICGHAITADSIYFNPSPDWITVV